MSSDFESVFSDMAARAALRPVIDGPPPSPRRTWRPELLAELRDWSTVVGLMQSLGRSKNAIHAQLKLLGSGLIQKRRQLRSHGQLGGCAMEYRAKR